MNHSSSTALERLARRIQRYLEVRAIGWQDLRLLLSQRSHKTVTEDVLRAAKSILVEGRAPQDRNGFRELVDQLNFIFDETFSTDIFDSAFVKVVKATRQLFSVVLLSVVACLVFYGIWGGYGGFQDLGPLARLALFAVLIVLLAAFEGLQISVTTLRLKDLEVLREKLPRAYQLHQKFRREEGARRFLAGRQLFVVVVVFLAAQLTSFPSFTPLSDAFGVSPALRWMEIVLLQYGVAGAFIVLWVGQLAPQFLANKHPHGFLNLPGMRLVLGLSFFVEALGLTRPGEWFSAFGTEEDEIPISPQERYRQAVQYVQGYGMLGVSKVWHIEPGGLTMTYKASHVLYRTGLDRILDNSLEVRGEGIRPEFKFRLFRRDDPEPVPLHVGGANEERLEDGWKRFHQEVEPEQGSFLEHDVLLVETGISFSAANSDAIRITKPTKFIVFRAKFGEPCSAKSGKLIVFSTEAKQGKFEKIRETPLPVSERDGESVMEYVEFYPRMNRYYLFLWDVERAGEPPAGELGIRKPG